MKKLILVILLWLLASSAHAATPVASCVAGVTNSDTAARRTAPLFVPLDCTGSTDADMMAFTTQPVHDLIYTHTTSRTNVGTFDNGLVRVSRNYATGPISGFVFEDAGTYTITSRVCDETSCAAPVVNTITVADPNSIFNDANTTCFYQTSPFGHCPDGGSETQNADFDSALGACKGAGKRCLFQRGSTFSASQETSIASAGGLIGAYGSGAPPIITSANIIPIKLDTGVSDLRIMDLDIRGSGSSDLGTCINNATGANSGITILRVKCSDIGAGLVLTGGTSLSKSVLQESTINNIAKSSSGYGVFGTFIDSAFIGNSIGPFYTTAEHNLRIQPGRRVMVWSNTLTEPGNSGKTTLTMRGGDKGTATTRESDKDTYFIYVANNRHIGVTSYEVVELAPASSSQNEWSYDVIYENNLIVMGSAGPSAKGFVMEAVDVTVRNNLCVSTGAPSGRDCFIVLPKDQTTYVAFPGNIRFFNNDCYASDTFGGFRCVNVDTTSTGTHQVSGTQIKNTLMYAPSATGAVVAASAGSGITGTVTATNTGDVGAITTYPFLTTPSLSNLTTFQPSTGYARRGGTCIFPTSKRDIFSSGPTVAEAAYCQIGAMRKRSDAISVGAR